MSFTQKMFKSTLTIPKSARLKWRLYVECRYNMFFVNIKILHVFRHALHTDIPCVRFHGHICARAIRTCRLMVGRKKKQNDHKAFGRLQHYYATQWMHENELINAKDIQLWNVICSKNQVPNNAAVE